MDQSIHLIMAFEGFLAAYLAYRDYSQFEYEGVDKFRNAAGAFASDLRLLLVAEIIMLVSWFVTLYGGRYQRHIYQDIGYLGAAIFFGLLLVILHRWEVRIS